MARGRDDQGAHRRAHGHGVSPRRRLHRARLAPGLAGRRRHERWLRARIRRTQSTRPADELSVAVEPVGTYRLRDFDQPVTLSAAAPLDEPLPKPVPVRAVPAQGHNLIAPATTFVGRDDAIAEVSRRLAPGRLLTIVGPGGMGKTRLAVELGLRVAAEWRDGVWIADLSKATNGRVVAATVADALGVSGGERDDRAVVLDHLVSRTALLILDSCEQRPARVGTARERDPDRMPRHRDPCDESPTARSCGRRALADRPVAVGRGVAAALRRPRAVPSARLRADARGRASAHRDLRPSRRHAACDRARRGSPHRADAGRDPRRAAAPLPAPPRPRSERPGSAADDARPARLGLRAARRTRASRPRAALGLRGQLQPAAPHRPRSGTAPSMSTMCPISCGRCPTSRSSTSNALREAPATGCSRPCVPTAPTSSTRAAKGRRLAAPSPSTTSTASRRGCGVSVTGSTASRSSSTRWSASSARWRRKHPTRPTGWRGSPTTTAPRPGTSSSPGPKRRRSSTATSCQCRAWLGSSRSPRG